MSFVKIDTAVLDSPAFKGLTLSGHMCYLAILKFRNNTTGQAWPSLTRIADWSGLSRSGVARGMLELESGALITRDKGRSGKSTVYTVTAGSRTGDTSSTDDTSVTAGTKVVAQVSPGSRTGDTLTRTRTRSKELVGTSKKSSVLPSKSLRDQMVCKSAEGAESRLSDMAYTDFMTDGKANAWAGIAIWSDVYWSAGMQPVITNHGMIGAQGKKLIQLAKDISKSSAPETLFQAAVDYCQAAMRLAQGASKYPLETAGTATLGRIIAQDAVNLIVAEMKTPAGAAPKSWAEVHKKEVRA